MLIDRIWILKILADNVQMWYLTTHCVSIVVKPLGLVDAGCDGQANIVSAYEAQYFSHIIFVANRQEIDTLVRWSLQYNVWAGQSLLFQSNPLETLNDLFLQHQGNVLYNAAKAQLCMRLMQTMNLQGTAHVNLGLHFHTHILNFEPSIQHNLQYHQVLLNNLHASLHHDLFEFPGEEEYLSLDMRQLKLSTKIFWFMHDKWQVRQLPVERVCRQKADINSSMVFIKLACTQWPWFLLNSLIARSIIHQSSSYFFSGIAHIYLINSQICWKRYRFMNWQ